MRSEEVARVYFVSLQAKEPKSAAQEKIALVCEAVGLNEEIEERDYVAIKLHFGEKGNDTHLPPHFVRPVVESVKDCGGKPFLTETCVLYRSRRSDAVSHLLLAEEHGFALRKIGAPVIMADGLLGDSEITVEIPGKLFSEVSLGREAMRAHGLIALTHVTGHMATGLGGTLKNLGMGLASRKGKLRQHSAMKPEIEPDKCTGCEQCVRWCPEETIEMRGDVAFIITEGCIGCGECLTMCRFDAIRYDWKVVGEDLQRKIAEHALGAVIQRREKSFFLNFVISVTRDCDCFNVKQKSIIDDIGLLASRDPVAVDTATLDLIKDRVGRPLHEMAYPNVDGLVQLQHGQDIGLGSMTYELVELNA